MLLLAFGQRWKILLLIMIGPRVWRRNEKFSKKDLLLEKRLHHKNTSDVTHIPSIGTRQTRLGKAKKTLNKQKNYGETKSFSECHHIMSQLFVRRRIYKIFEIIPFIGREIFYVSKFRQKKIPVPGNYYPARRTGPRVFRVNKNPVLAGGACCRTLSATLRPHQSPIREDLQKNYKEYFRFKITKNRALFKSTELFQNSIRIFKIQYKSLIKILGQFSVPKIDNFSCHIFE